MISSCQQKQRSNHTKPQLQPGTSPSMGKKRGNDDVTLRQNQPFPVICVTKSR
jgi:hypothetical protein